MYSFIKLQQRGKARLSSCRDLKNSRNKEQFVTQLVISPLIHLCSAVVLNVIVQQCPHGQIMWPKCFLASFRIRHMLLTACSPSCNSMLRLLLSSGQLKQAAQKQSDTFFKLQLKIKISSLDFKDFCLSKQSSTAMSSHCSHPFQVWKCQTTP